MRNQVFSSLTFCCWFLIFSLCSHIGYGQGGKKIVSYEMAHKTSIATTDDNRTFGLPPHFNGFNAQMMRGPSWHAPGFAEKVKELHPKLIRYPGGTVASYWDWKTGWLKDEINIKQEWKNIRRNPITIDDLKYGCDETGALPVFVLNMVTSTLAYQLEMLRYARSIGLPVNYVELDNELYLGDPFYVKRFATGVDYAQEANKWIYAIKSEFPGAKVAVVGNSTREGPARKEKNHFARANSWNRDVLSAIKDADAMTFHVYGGTGLNFLSKGAVDDVESDEASLEALQATFEQPESISVLLGIPFQRWRNANTYDYQILPEGMKAWITEYNLFEREGVVAGTWAHGLYALLQTLCFMQNEKTAMICYHNLTTSAQFAAIFNSDQGFIKAVKKKPNKALEFTAAGYCLSMFGKAVENGGDATKIRFSNVEELSGARGLKYPALEGWVIRSDEGSKIIAVNLSAESVATDFSKVIKGSAGYTQISSQPLTQVASAQDITRKTGKGTSVNLVPYSVTIIETE